MPQAQRRSTPVPNLWPEAPLLTVGSLDAPTPYEQRQAFVTALCQIDGPLPVALAAAELAATGLGDLTEPEPKLQEMARDRLVALLSDPALVEAKPAARAAAGRALAILGDPRDFAELVEIPAGPFLMGDDRDDKANPQHEIILPAFKMGRYPVTNAQYRQPFTIHHCPPSSLPPPLVGPSPFILPQNSFLSSIRCCLPPNPLPKQKLRKPPLTS